MIKGEVNAEKLYRAISTDSSSSLKDFDKDRKKYYRRHVLGEKIEDEESKALTMGRVVETKLLEPELFDDRFFPSMCETTPTEGMLKFVEALYKYTKEATNEEGEVIRDFKEISMDAYKDSGYKIAYEAVMKKFMGSDAESYYQEIREVRSKGLTVISLRDAGNAERIVEQLQNDQFIGKIVNLANSFNYDVYNQLQITDVTIAGLKMKGMIDKLIVDHKKKTIHIYDLKCTWAVENFYREYYLYRRGDIQAGVYYMLTLHHFNHLVKEGYTVNPPSFIVCDSGAYYAPLIYDLGNDDIVEAMNGFEYKGTKYKGILEIIEDVKWAKDMDIWNMSRDNYISNGRVKIK
jgi:hypothetical protein